MKKIQLKQEYKVGSVCSFQLFTYQSDFIYKSEYHDHFMLYYIKEGSLEFSFSDQHEKNLLVPESGLFIQPPYAHYSFRSGAGHSAQVFCVGFSCDSAALSLLCSYLHSLTDRELRLLSAMEEELAESFSPDIKKDGTISLSRAMLQPFGGEQLIGNYLEILFIFLARLSSKNPSQKSLPSYSPEDGDFILFQKITQFYRERAASYLSLEEICLAFSIGQNHLQRIFRRHTGMGAIEYFCHIRIDAAKELMRLERTSPAETAKRMGYHTAHYFSKQFKQITGMSPTKYLSLIKNAEKYN